MRIDKMLANVGYGSRKDVKKLLKAGAVQIDGVKIKDAVKKWLEGLLQSRFDEQKKDNEDMKKSLEDLKAQLADVDLENCKNYLVTFLAETERGELKDEIEIQRFYEEYQHYIDKGGNSYVKEKYAKMKQKGYL